MKKVVGIWYLLIIGALAFHGGLSAMGGAHKSLMGNRRSGAGSAASELSNGGHELSDGGVGGGIERIVTARDRDNKELSEQLLIEMQEVERPKLRTKLDTVLSQSSKQMLKPFQGDMVEKVLGLLAQDASCQAFMGIGESGPYISEQKNEHEQDQGQNSAQNAQSKKRAEQKFMVKLMAGLTDAQREKANSETQKVEQMESKIMRYLYVILLEFAYMIVVPQIIMAFRHDACP